MNGFNDFPINGFYFKYYHGISYIHDGVNKLIPINGILIFHIMDYTYKFTWMDLLTFPSMGSV